MKGQGQHFKKFCLLWIKKFKNIFGTFFKKSAKKSFRKCLFYCFPKFHKDSLKIKCDMTKNVNQLIAFLKS